MNTMLKGLISNGEGTGHQDPRSGAKDQQAGFRAALRGLSDQRNCYAGRPQSAGPVYPDRAAGLCGS